MGQVYFDPCSLFILINRCVIWAALTHSQIVAHFHHFILLNETHQKCNHTLLHLAAGEGNFTPECYFKSSSQVVCNDLCNNQSNCVITKFYYAFAILDANSPIVGKLCCLSVLFPPRKRRADWCPLYRVFKSHIFEISIWNFFSHCYSSHKKSTRDVQKEV